MKQSQYSIIGLMSGTSLDGLDIALCHFKQTNDQWDFSIVESKTYRYSKAWKKRLQNIENESALNFVKTDSDLGLLFAEKVNTFLIEFDLEKTSIDAIASHGHTIFHQPHLGFSTQIGNGAQLCAKTGIKTIVDFRAVDVALGGQGAPLVPIGDQLLFSEYDYCLNIGGIANISSQQNELRIAKDITFANMIGNHICQKINQDFDDQGKLAQSGSIHPPFLELLTKTVAISTKNNASLGKETFVKHIQPYIDQLKISVEDQLHTLAHHLSDKIADNITPKSSLLITGGGAFNDFWIKLIQEKSKAKITIPDHQLIEFKEALIFAFLGALRLNNVYNSLSSVTGARKDAIGGCIYTF
ncbi:MAG: anhydro-N-acetylmuramic acid kinase [Flavobacteriales bacterium]|jgi:anhydro-N-acetylmuramic acid kinase|nr:anhydro-N-acetylmuramic acid kinase [Flavobacteriales bacterium]